MNYSELSDNEINERVARIRCEKLVGFFDDGEWCKDPDYCNNPSYAWPLIVENKIDIQWSVEGALCLALDINSESIMVRDKSPLKAAMIVYLQLQEATQ